MPKLTRNNFTGGQVSSDILIRNDLQKFQSCTRRTLNMVTNPQGGLESRRGFQLVDEVSDPSLSARLVPFEFSEDQTYVFLLNGTGRPEVYENGQLLRGITWSIQIGDGRFSSAFLAKMDYSQQFDTLILTSEGHTPILIQRYGYRSFRIREMDIGGNRPEAPYLKNLFRVTANNVYTRVPANYGYGALVLAFDDYDLANVLGNKTVIKITNGSAGVKNLGLVGRELVPLTSGFYAGDPSGNERWCLTFPLDIGPPSASMNHGPCDIQYCITGAVGSGGGDTKKAYTYQVSTVVNGVESPPSATISTNLIDSLSQTFAAFVQWGTDDLHFDEDADVYYRVYKGNSPGTGRAGWIGDTEQTFLLDYNTAPLTSDAPVQERDPIRAGGGGPSATTFHQQRLIVGGTTDEPFAMHMSNVGDYFNFDRSRPARDADAFSLPLFTGKADRIKFLVPHRTLLVFTQGSIHSVGGRDDLFTESAVTIEKVSDIGTHDVRPVIADQTVLYVDRGGSRVRDLSYEWSNDAWAGSDLTLFLRHKFEGRFVRRMAYAQDPVNVLWSAVAGSKGGLGGLMGLTFNKEHEISAWHTHTFAGAVTPPPEPYHDPTNLLGSYGHFFVGDVCTVPEDGSDALYAVVYNGYRGDVACVVRLGDRDAPCLDFWAGVGVGTLPPEIDLRAGDGIAAYEHPVGAAQWEHVLLIDGVALDVTPDENGVISLYDNGIKPVGDPVTSLILGVRYDQVVELPPIWADAPLSGNTVPVAVRALLDGSAVPRISASKTPLGPVNYDEEVEIVDPNDYGVQIGENPPLKSGVVEVRAPGFGWGTGQCVALRSRDHRPVKLLAVELEVDTDD